MSQQYFKTVGQTRYLTMLIAAIGVAAALWSILAGLAYEQMLLVQGPAVGVAQYLSGLRLQLLILLAISARLGFLLWGNRVGHAMALIALLASVGVFLYACVWSQEVLREMHAHEAEYERPLAFLFGAPPGALIVYGAAFFLSFAEELAVVVVAAFRYYAAHHAHEPAA